MQAKGLGHWMFFALMLGTMGLPSAVAADEPPKTSIEVTIPNMHCEACAKKIRGQLFTIAGVAKVTTHVADHRAEIIPGSGKVLSAFEIWDKLEKSKFTPTRLVTPDAEYTQKPPRAKSASP